MHIGIDVEECAQSRHPLIEQLLTVHQNQGIRISLGYQVAGDHGFAECRGGRKHSSIVRQQGMRGSFLVGGERSKKAGSNRSTITPLVPISARIPFALRRCSAAPAQPRGERDMFREQPRRKR